MQEVTAARSEVHKLQTSLMQRDAELERRNLENRSLAQDKASLERLLQERESEIQELQARLQAGAVRRRPLLPCPPPCSGLRSACTAPAVPHTYLRMDTFSCGTACITLPGLLTCVQDKVVALTNTNTQLDAQVHEAQAAQSRAALKHTRLEQEKEILEKGSRWLSEELERKSEAFSAERRKATDTILDLQRRLGEAEAATESTKAEHDRLAGRFEAQRQAAEEASKKLREVRGSAAAREEDFEKELAMAQRMAQLYRDNAEERARKCGELEGVVAELRAHMEVRGLARGSQMGCDARGGSTRRGCIGALCLPPKTPVTT